MNISLSKWVEEQIIGNTKNRSGRVEELIIKGWAAENGISLKNSENIKSIPTEKIIENKIKKVSTSSNEAKKEMRVAGFERATLLELLSGSWAS